MSVWTTKTLDRVRDYIVIRHSLRGVNHKINGVTFRDGYAVVEKNSKTYVNLMKMPVLNNCLELPLISLKDLKFVNRPLDIQNVYGRDVYVTFLKELEKFNKEQKEAQKIETVKKHIEEGIKCKFVASSSNSLCEKSALDCSPSGFCKYHILEDPQLESMGIEIPKFMTKVQRSKVKDDVITKLQEIKLTSKKVEENGEIEQN